MDPALIARNDVFPASRALALGMSRTELRRLLREGRVVRLHRGWYSSRQPEDDIDQHLLRVEALLTEYAGHAVATNASALLRLGLPTYRPDLARVHLVLTDPALHRHRKPDLVVHPFVPVPEGLEPTRRGTVHPAVAMAACGLPDPRAFLVAADAGLGRGLVSREQLARAVDGLGRRRGVAGVRAVLDWCDPRHESPGESLTAYVLRMAGFALEPQFGVPGTEHWTPGGQGYRADFRIAGTRVLVEFDGRVKYTDQRSVWDEKVREDRIRSLGYEVIRLTWADLRDPVSVRAKVIAALRRAGA
ncbi:hypothetical protein N865_05745 [Intrasporangium oryzae NRRL B-24470]|uniref:AbiEi antitoxin N-terminal domain-containing protein n=1 Tax=Intrasporangium oryzae NRRL B-24470 TaxID=1386089 RepID=W9G4J9_9MICO|nr:type IV toxin-antitoxin system AbiEi family antitoxin domain-containing protein [Intrasporangium oryzae]EWT00950.1 hypothetical protein N865_05745 [Intrasporangium oryzae NRRL B-24470]